MNSVARVFVVVNILLAAIVMMAMATFLQQNEDWKGKHGDLEKKSAEAAGELQDQINVLNNEKKRLNDDLQAKTAKISSLESEKSDLTTRLTDAEEAKSQALRDKQQVTANNGTLASKTGELADRMKGMEDMVDRYVKRADDAAGAAVAAKAAETAAKKAFDGKVTEIHDLSKELATLKARWKSTADQLAAYVAMYPPPALGTQPKVDGQVVRFDAAANVVEINKGKSAGVKIGHSFDIVRANSGYVCSVKVNQVVDNASYGSVEIRYQPDSEPMSGDRATKLSSVK